MTLDNSSGILYIFAPIIYMCLEIGKTNQSMSLITEYETSSYSWHFPIICRLGQHIPKDTYSGDNYTKGRT